jgi:2-oxoglutarate ferredoxin oxidoreductase subunit delta
MAPKGYVEIAIEVCKGCNLCVLSCPTDCLALNTSDTNIYGLHYSTLSKPEECIGCANCAVMCPDAAITVYRKKKEKAAQQEGRQ